MNLKSTLLTAFGATTKESLFNTVIAFFGTIATSFLGGWDTALKALVYFMIIDYATGLLGAIKHKKIDSDIMFWGGVRKGIVLLVVAMSVLLDALAGNQAPVFRTLALYYYIGREGLSVIENFGIMGVPWPSFISKFLTQLKEKGENENVTDYRQDQSS